MCARLASDFERFRQELPRDFPAYIRDAYRIDLTARYLGRTIPHPIGKGSGQLSLNSEQLEADAAAGLAFVVLKTVIAEDERGHRSMGAWALSESRMRVEPIRSASGREGWTVTWKGRGWDRSLDEYLELVRAGRDLERAGRLLVVPSVKYHLPGAGEEFRDAEYRFTTGRFAEAWGQDPLLVEKDFSPTLAGDALADERGRILRWVREIPERIRQAAPGGARIALKLMNARFDDGFQREMLAAGLASGADTLVVFNRLFDPVRGVAYGGFDLSDRNLRSLDLPPAAGNQLPATESSRLAAGRPKPAVRKSAVGMTGTGNIGSGRMILEYARRGCESVQLHTFFQLPLGEYPATRGSRTQRALHTLVFHPEDGLIAGMLEMEEKGELGRENGELRFRDIAAGIVR